MTRFEKGIEYKLYRKNGDLAERTAKCTGINRELGAIRFEIIGSELEGFAKYGIVVLKLKSDELKNSETANDLNFKTYLGLYATDRIA